MFEIIQEPDYDGSISRIMMHMVVPGEPDPNEKDGLSERGKNQIFELARSRLLAGPSKIYAPNSKECVTSAEILAKELYSSTTKMDCLHEIDLGTKETDEEYLRTEMTNLWNDLNYEPKNGESLRNAQIRISSCIDRITRMHPESTIGVVLPPIVAVLFHNIVVGGILLMEDWLHLGFASCATYEYSKNGWALVMPPESSFLSDASKVIDILPPGVF
ncbi:MAG: histidine phosphatase family protein [Candidatus Thorarchaeota archaeon]|nr:histidine phosphatase family protein [Candidatus Thorarchaeota archaeon]